MLKPPDTGMITSVITRSIPPAWNRENPSSPFLQAMRKERLIGIFPEGTTKAKAGAKTGVIHFARLTRKPLLPVHLKVDGQYPPRYPFRFPRVTVSIGKAISLKDLEKEIPILPERSSERAFVLTKRLMEHIDAT